MSEDDLPIERIERNEIPAQEAPTVAPREWLFFRMAVMLAVFCVAYLVLFINGGEPSRFATAGLEVVPFVILAVLAYVGQERRWGKVITLLYWFALAAGVCFVVLIFAIIGVIPPENIWDDDGGVWPGTSYPRGHRIGRITEDWVCSRILHRRCTYRHVVLSPRHPTSLCENPSDRT